MTKALDTAAWDLAEITTKDGFLGRPWGTSRIVVPCRIELGEDDTLLWSYGWPSETIPERIVKIVRPERGMLDQFVRLSRVDTSPEEICDYARRWGVLSLCQHGRPSGHNPACIPKFFMKGDVRWYSEPLKSWRRCSRTAAAVVNAAAKLNTGKDLTAEETLEVLVQSGYADLQPEFQGPMGARRWLSNIVEMWIYEGGVRPRITWQKGHWLVYLHPEFPGTFGALGCQVMQAIANSRGIAMCSGCHEAYEPKRAPDPRRNHFCEQCGRAAALRAAARKYRERKTSSRSRNVATRKQEDVDVKER